MSFYGYQELNLTVIDELHPAPYVRPQLSPKSKQQTLSTQSSQNSSYVVDKERNAELTKECSKDHGPRHMKTVKLITS